MSLENCFPLRRFDDLSSLGHDRCRPHKTRNSPVDLFVSSCVKSSIQLAKPGSI
jgi:hypothetical protein